jgi:hypothetical protein
MHAYVFVPETAGERYPKSDELRDILRAHNVVYGINDKMVEEIAEAKICNQKIEVARGKNPIPGKPGNIEILIERVENRKPKVLSDGRVDQKDIGFIINVKKGTPLIRRIPSQEGIAGMSVLGRPIDTPAVRDVKIQAGPGTVWSKDDPDVIVADQDGAVLIDKSGNVEVRNQKTIRQDIDYGTGNIEFVGNLLITGAVRAGFKVTADGSVTIKRNVENAQIFSGRDIVVHGGVCGSGSGVMKAGRGIKLRHVENFSVEADHDIVIVEDAVHSTMRTEGSINARCILGGETYAGTCLEVDILGADGEPKTVIDLGKVYALNQKRNSYLKKITHTMKKLGEANEELFTRVRDGMNAKGNLTKQQEQELTALKQEKKLILQEYNTIKNELQELENRCASTESQSVRVRKMFPNVIFKIGNKQKRITTIILGAIVTTDEDNIVFRKL